MSIEVKGFEGFENSSWFRSYKPALVLQMNKVLAKLDESGYTNEGTSFWYLYNNYRDGKVYFMKGIKNYGYVSSGESCRNRLEEEVLALVEMLNHLAIDSNIVWNCFVLPNKTSFCNGNAVLSTNVYNTAMFDTTDNSVMHYVLNNSSVVLFDNHKVGIQLKNLGDFEESAINNSINSKIASAIKKCLFVGNDLVAFLRNKGGYFKVSSIALQDWTDDYEMYICKTYKGEKVYLRITY